MILQPTHTAEQKRKGTYVHAALVDVGLSALIAGLVVIEVAKIGHGGVHFASAHAVLGLLTYVALLLQAVVGFTQFFLPGIYGGEARAKKVYKYHRQSGYVVLALSLGTVAAATHTDYVSGVLHLKLVAVLVAAVLILAGVLARVRKQKLGW